MALQMQFRPMAQGHRRIVSSSTRPVPLVRDRAVTLVRVAAIEPAAQQAGPLQPEETLAQTMPEQPAQQDPYATAIIEADDDNAELEELDAAAEEALAWLVNHSEEEQEADLDEMVDYDEFGDDEYVELYEEVERMIDATDSSLRIGDTVVGTVYQVDEEGAYVELGQKASGFVPLAECSFAKLKTALEVLRVGMRREFIVVDKEDDYGQIVLSLAAIEASIFWQRIRQYYEEGVTVTVTVESANKGGLLVKYGPYEGFVPVSQFGQAITVETMEAFVGQNIEVNFLEVDEERERLVFSHKKASGTSAVQGQTGGWKIGDVVDGVVASVKPYGAFVDIGGSVGLLHISQISSQRVTQVDKVLKEGDKLKVLVLGHDRERGRLTLSTKKLEAQEGDMLRNPQLVWENAEKAAADFKQRLATAEAMASQTPNPAATDPIM